MLTVAQAQYSLPSYMLPQQQQGRNTMLDADAAPFQPSMLPVSTMLPSAQPLSTLPMMEANRAQAMGGKRRGGRHHAHNDVHDSLPHATPYVDPREDNGTSDKECQRAPELVQRERWARSRIARMELTEAARIEMQLQNLNIKRSASVTQLSQRLAGTDQRNNQQQAPRTCERPDDSEGNPIYEFGNGMPGGVCVYFMKGYCGLGARCRYVHDSTDPGHIVKITGMPYVATAREVAEFFAPLEIIEGGVRFLLSSEGRPTGSAFVEFKDRHAALVAVGKDRAFFTANRFVLIFASSKKERDWYLMNPQPFSQSRAILRRGLHDHEPQQCEQIPATYQGPQQHAQPPQQQTPAPPRIIRVIRHCPPPSDVPQGLPQGVPQELLNQPLPPALLNSPQTAAIELLQQQQVIREQQQMLQQQQILLQNAQELLAPPTPALYTPHTHGAHATPYASATTVTTPMQPTLPLPEASPLTPEMTECQLRAAAGMQMAPVEPSFPQGAPVHNEDNSPVRALLPTFNDDSAESSFISDTDSPQQARPKPQLPGADVSGAVLLEHLGAQLQGRALASLTGMDNTEVVHFLQSLGYAGGQQQAICEELDQIRSKAQAVHAAAQKLFPAQQGAAPADSAAFDDMPPLVPGDGDCDQGVEVNA